MGTNEIGAFEKFLTYGPIGLAGLMLVLVIVAMTVRETSERQGSLLKFFMVIGAICFLASTAAEFFAVKSAHRVSVLVAPQNFGPDDAFPPPILRVDGDIITGNTFEVSGATSLVVDVVESVGVFRAVSATADQATSDLVQTSAQNAQLIDAVAGLETEVQTRDIALREAARVAEELDARFEAITEIQPVAPSPSMQRAIREFDTLQRSLDRTLSIQP